MKQKAEKITDELFKGKECPVCEGKLYLKTFDKRREFICTECGYLTSDIEVENVD